MTSDLFIIFPKPYVRRFKMLIARKNVMLLEMVDPTYYGYGKRSRIFACNSQSNSAFADGSRFVWILVACGNAYPVA